MQGRARDDCAEHGRVQGEVRHERQQGERLRKVRLGEGEEGQEEQETEEQEEARENAAKKCKAERGTTAQTIEAFKQKYGTNKNKANAFGKCVSKLAKAQTTS